VPGHLDEGDALDRRALFLRTQPRIVLLDDYRIDGLPSGPALIMSNRDVPGVIGQVGTLLGHNDITLASGAWAAPRRGK